MILRMMLCIHIIHTGLCETESPLRMFCIVCRRQSTPLSTSPPTEIRLDLNTRYKAKIAVSSTDKSLGLSRKHAHPRQVQKRSVSFSYSPSKDATKGLQRIFRSASSSERLGSGEEAAALPAILSEVSVESSMNRNRFVGDNSRVLEHNSSNNKSSIAFERLRLCSNSITNHEKFQDKYSCYESETERANTTTSNLKGSVSNLATSIECSTVSKKAFIRSDSKGEPPQSLQRLKVQANCNTSSNLQCSDVSSWDFPPLRPSSSIHHREKTFLATRKSPLKPSTVEVSFQGNPCFQHEPTCRTTVRETYEASLGSTTSAHSTLECFRMASRKYPSTPLGVQRLFQESSSTGDGRKSSRTDERVAKIPLRIDSTACSPLEWSRATMRKPEVTPLTVRHVREDTSLITDVASPSSFDRRQCNVSPSPIPAQSLSECSSVTRSESQVPGEDSSASLLRESPLPFWPDSPLLFFSRSDSIPFLSNASENSPVQLTERLKCEKGSLIYPLRVSSPTSADTSQRCDGLSGKTADSLSTSDKVSLSFEVGRVTDASSEKTPNNIDSHLEEWKSQLAYHSNYTKGLHQVHGNLEMSQKGKTIDLKIAESANTEESELNHEVALYSLKNAPSLPAPLYANWDLHDNMETVDMEISESTNLESRHLNEEDVSNSSSCAVSTIEIPDSDWQDNMEIVDMEISESLPSRIVLSQAKSCVPLKTCFRSSLSHPDSFANSSGDITPFRGNNQVRMPNDRMFASLSPNESHQPLLSTVLGSSCLASGHQQNSKDKALGNIKSHSIEATDSIANIHLLKTKDVVEGETKSLVVDSASPRMDRTEFRDNLKAVNMDTKEDSKLITVVCEKDNRPYGPTENIRLPGDCNTKNRDEDRFEILGSSLYEAVENSSEDANSSEQKAAGTKEETLEETCYPAPQSCPSLSVEQSTFSSRTDASQGWIQHPVSPAPKLDTKAQICSPSGQESVVSCTALSCGKISAFSLSPRKSPKVSIHRLKTLQDAFKAATNLNESDTISKTKRSSSINSVRSMSRILTVSPSMTRGNDSNSETLDRVDSSGVENSVAPSAMDFKTPVVSSTALKKDVSCLPKQVTSCLGGVVELSLIEDWGFQGSADDCSEAELKVKRSCQLDMEQGGDTIDTNEAVAASAGAAWRAVEDCDIAEPETVVCSPAAPSKTFSFRFPGNSGFHDHFTGENITRTIQEETAIVEQRFRGVVPELVLPPDVNSETMLPPSEELVSKARPSKEHNEDASSKDECNTCEWHALVPQILPCPNLDAETGVSSVEEHVPETYLPEQCNEGKSSKYERDINESCGVDSQAVTSAVSAPGLVKESTNFEYVNEFFGTLGCVNEDVMAVESCCKQLQNCEKHCLGGLLKIQKPNYLKVAKETLAIDPENLVTPQTRDTSFSDSPEKEKCCTKMSSPRISVTALKNLTDILEENTKMKPEEWSCEVQRIGKCSEKRERERLLSLQEHENEINTFDITGGRISLSELLEEKHPNNMTETAKQVKWSEKVSCLADEKKKDIAFEIETKKGSESVNLCCSSQSSAAMEGKLAHLENVTESMENGICSGNVQLSKKENGREILHENTTGCSLTEAKAVSTKAKTLTTDRKRNESENSHGSTTTMLNMKAADRTVRVANLEQNIEIKIGSPYKTVDLLVKSTEENRMAPNVNKLEIETVEAVQAVKGVEIKSHSQNTTAQSTLGSGKTVRDSKVNDSTVKADESLKTTELKSASSSKTARSTVKSTEESVKIAKDDKSSAAASKKVEALHSSLMRPCSSKNFEAHPQREKNTNGDCAALYRDTRVKTEPLRDIKHLHRDNRIQNMKRKLPSEPEWWGKQMFEKGIKRPKLTPPPPLVPFESGLWREHKARESSREFYNRDHFCRPYSERDQFDFQFPQLHCIRERQRSRTINEQLSYRCWSFPQPPPLHVNSRGHHLTPDDPRWGPQRSLSAHDPRADQVRFEQVHPGFPDRERASSVPSQNRGRPVLTPPPPLIPRPWSHTRYPPFRPR